MKVISLWQPWASLIAIGAKKYETRSWYTPYRGPLLIHAAQTKTEMWNLSHEPFRSALAPGGEVVIPFGQVLCLVDLVEVVPVENVIGRIGERERAFGDYTPHRGRYAWKLDNLRLLRQFIPLRGQRRLWDADPDLVEAVLHQLGVRSNE